MRRRETHVYAAGDRLFCSVPRDAKFECAAQELGARWNRWSEEWVFLRTQEYRARLLLDKHFGEGHLVGVPDVTVHVDIHCGQDYVRRDFVCAGIKLLDIDGDSVRVLRGVVVAGGVRSPVMGRVRAELVLEVERVPLSVAALAIERGEPLRIVGG